MSASTPPDYLEIGFSRINHDLIFLMEAFGEVLKELGLDDLAAHLPWVGKPETRHSDSKPEHLNLAYAVAFQLLNLVEENVAAWVREQRESYEGAAAERGLWGNQLNRLKSKGLTEEQIASQLPLVRVEPVLTAHPTEAKRLAVLEHHRTLFRLLQNRSDSARSPHRTFKQVKASLERLWRTGEILLEKPTLRDERRNVLHYFREIFPEVLPELDERLTQAWKEAGFDPECLKKPGALPRLRFGTWVGGDRDGHPGVTADVTIESLERLRVNALIVHYRGLSALAEKITLTTWMQAPSEGLLALREKLLKDIDLEAASQAEEPWRQVVELMLAKLPVKVAPGHLSELREGPGLYVRAGDLIQDLQALRASLCETGAVRLAETDIDPLLRALEVFGFHLATLDVRQNSEFHTKALTQLMAAAGVDGSDWEEWKEDERLRYLQNELRSPRPYLPPGVSAGPEADAVLACYRGVVRHMEKFGSEGVGSLIISMTRRLSDLLMVHVLAREAGLMRRSPEGLLCVLPVVPLFETADDLARGPDILRRFVDQPVTRRSLEYHANDRGQQGRLIQQVMVGYSDSNKDAGILASQWALHQAQRELSAAARDAGVEAQFFHGRGGTVSRGAGPTHRFLDALPHGSLCGDIRLTEQGETIAQKYGNRSTAAYNLELLLAGVSGTAALHASGDKPPHVLEPLAEKLANASRVAYRQFLEADGFMAFYRQATPIDALEHSRIGSRPSRRTGQATLADLRAIPWVFAWNQCRFYVPGWYGAGSGLAALNQQEFEQLSQELRSWPFLHYVITNIESSLASTDRDLMAAYAGLVEDEALRDRLFGMVMKEYDLTQAMLTKLRGGELESKRPRMWKTLELRAEALKVLHQQQIDLLRRWRSLHKEGDEAGAHAMLPEVLLSVNAIASGLRTTG